MSVRYNGRKMKEMKKMGLAIALCGTVMVGTFSIPGAYDAAMAKNAQESVEQNLVDIDVLTEYVGIIRESMVANFSYDSPSFSGFVEDLSEIESAIHIAKLSRKPIDKDIVELTEKLGVLVFCDAKLEKDEEGNLIGISYLSLKASESISK